MSALVGENGGMEMGDGGGGIRKKIKILKMAWHCCRSEGLAKRSPKIK